MYLYDKYAVEKVKAFLTQRCKNIAGPNAGEYLKLLDWQVDFIEPLFGEKTRDGRRRYTHGFLWIPKKQGKSTLTSGLSLYLLGPEDEKGAKVFSLAGDTDQARIIFDDAKTMISEDEVLERLFTVRRNDIQYLPNNSTYKVLSAESKTKHGLNVSAGIFDELHVQPDHKLWETITKGVAARKNPLILSLSNAGIKNTFPHEIFEMCQAAAAGDKDLKHWLVRIYMDDTPDENESPFSMDRIKRANPAFGQTVDEAYYEREIGEIKQRPSGLNTYKRLHLGVWVGAYESWIPANVFAECAIKKVINFEEFRNYECFIGVDFSATSDLTSIVYFWDTFDELGYFVWYSFNYCPVDKITEKSNRKAGNYAEWARSLYLRHTPGRIIDLEPVFEDFAEFAPNQFIKGLGYDSWRADEFVSKAQESYGLKVFPITQTTKILNRPVEFVEKAIYKGLLKHVYNPILDWQLGNIVMYRDSNDCRRPIKKESKDKIDTWCALLNAIAVYEHFRIKRRKPSIFTIVHNGGDSEDDDKSWSIASS